MHPQKFKQKPQVIMKKKKPFKLNNQMLNRYFHICMGENLIYFLVIIK